MSKGMKIFIIFLLGNIWASEAQCPNQHLDHVSRVFEVKEHRHDFSGFMKTDNEVKLFFGFVYWVYKNFISSQDLDSCVFVPSCSTYMMLSIRKNGVFLGFLDGMDRLTRCGPFATGKYPYNPKVKKYEDPVE